MIIPERTIAERTIPERTIDELFFDECSFDEKTSSRPKAEARLSCGDMLFMLPARQVVTGFLVECRSACTKSCE
jgi:hypothetical protein